MKNKLRKPKTFVEKFGINSVKDKYSEFINSLTTKDFQNGELFAKIPYLGIVT